mmetsp:Transcript_37714/g.43074  ORF Transcript_37714/g.43074 Transcript_37714/m.43074 type:complete len:242 (+) Transcript_37714:71-796(+)|eukprot:CAMPEP_0194146920 /NCGR_PEP_ID=MMETSP0152-20130528/22414_1 /TAXON_ID=1049557 /ORGANISM="Thalassiothrix antarctica, Strain L6-D1" /LENGTH=241 /DNA_ID=CAMNT_0038847577 /DNA_START=42 /DNA_END=767 /DNA_ORIENTATION=-
MQKSILSVAAALFLASSASADRWDTPAVEENVESRRRCAVKENGFYGDSAETSTIVALPFLEIEISSTSEKSDEEIIGGVERGIVDVVLPELFPYDCLPTSMGLRSRRRLDAIGMSSQPPDVVLEGVSCDSELSSEDNSCIFVESSFTIYTTDEASTEVQVAARNAIQQAISNGYFNSDDIVGMNLAEDIPVVAESNFETRGAGSVGGDSDIVAYTVIPIACAVLIVGAAVYVKKRTSPSV